MRATPICSGLLLAVVTTRYPGDPGTPTVRRAGRADLLAVHRIERVSFGEPWPYAAFETFLGTDGFLVAENEHGGVVGYVVANLLADSARQIGHVKDLAVAPTAREQGVGSQLLDRSVAVLNRKGATAVKLEVRESNTPALELYRSREFNHRRTVAGYYADGEDARILIKTM
ncbi:MAG: acetyltransferase [halophilic archaeon J07HX5]|nr:MAG: acetyltransferase [halophilic archaeon J07HX5]